MSESRRTDLGKLLRETLHPASPIAWDDLPQGARDEWCRIAGVVAFSVIFNSRFESPMDAVRRYISERELQKLAADEQGYTDLAASGGIVDAP